MVTLYDLIPLVFPHLYLSHPTVEGFYSRRFKLVQEADHILAISKSTRDDAIRLLGVDPDRVSVIYGGVSDYFRPPEGPPEEVRARVHRRLPEITGQYILSMMFTDEFGKRKNLEAAITAYARLPEELRKKFQLVIVGHGIESDHTRLVAHAQRNRVEERVTLAGLATEDLLRDLYQACDMFIFPSLYEGLGLPILEAMRCGAPVIASDRSSIKELVEMDRARFNPEDSADIARVMGETLTDAQFQRDLREYGLQRSRQFTWERVAQVTAEAYREIGTSLAQGRTWPVERTRSLAFCTPFPPERCGVADYTRCFLKTLCDRHPLKVDVVVKGDPDSYVPPNHAAITLVSARQFRWLAERGHYDRIIYGMGNTSFHDYVYELLKEHRGTVWLHDVRLTDFYHCYYRQLGRDLSTLPEELLPWTQRYPDCEDALIARDIIAQHQQGIYLAGEVASYAQKIMVNSRFSKELVEIESGGRVPVVAVPLAAPPLDKASLRESWPQLAAKHSLDQSATLVVSSGYITALKCPEAVIDAFAAVASPDRNAVLAFIGPCEPPYQRELEHRASLNGIGDRVRFTGYVGDAELDSWLTAARCAIQLRFPTNGESSAAVMRCLAAGVPTIVTDHGPLRELPDDAVVKVPAPVEPDVLANDLLRVLSDDRACEGLRRGALRYAQQVSFEAVADQFWSEVLCLS